LAVLTVLAALFFMNRFTSRLRQIPVGTTPDAPLKAKKIARALKVKHVIMGHTHVADIRPLDNRGGLYADTGTWTAIKTAWEHLQPRARRFTFVRIRGDRLQLLRWNDEAGRIDRVLFFEDYTPSAADVLFPSDPMRNPPEAEKPTSLTETLDQKPWDPN
jgi:hypothetical protein